MKMKQNISNQTNGTDNLPPVLENLRYEVTGFRVPNGYFDSLNSRIVDEIKKQENKSLLKSIVHSFRKPLVWAPVATIFVISLLLIFVAPLKKNTTNQVADEWTEINMVYDPSYAAEALLAERNSIDKELEGNDINYSEPVSLTGQNQPTDAEIEQYLKEHEIDADILNEY